VQNFRAKPDTPMASSPEPDGDEFLAAIAMTRIALGPLANVQAPPNLSDEGFPRLLDAGINDWGGISPVTPDHVNPEKPWPNIERLREATEARGCAFRERLTAYPHYVLHADPWIHARMREPLHALATADGYAREGLLPAGAAWQDPDVVAHIPLSADLRSIEDDTASRDALYRGLRGDTDEVHGSWDAIEVDASRAWRARKRPADSELAAALSRAADGATLSDADALALFEAEGEALERLCAVADEVRREAVGDVVTYVVNRNINFTNVCYVGCRFCAFAQRRVDPDAYFLSLEEVTRRAAEAWQYGATEVCIQGGIHPDLPGDYYFDILRAIKAQLPAMHIHAFSPMEIMNGSARLGISFQEWLSEAAAAGLGSIPGTAAEILDDDVRWVLTKGKLPADTWERIVRTAHGLGIRSSSTIMDGHVDAPPHWVAHMRRLRRIQEDTGGFTEFVPLPFVHQNAPIYLAGKARPGPTLEENRRMHAVARLLLHDAIPNVQVSWVKIGVGGAQAMLRGGANDFGGTLMEETISRMAGAAHGIRLEPNQIRSAVREIGRIPAERNTTYDRVVVIEEPDPIPA
jgi:FO synthase